jgi:hypothetical protein
MLGDCFLWAVFENCKILQNFGVTFARSKSWALVLAQNGFGLYFGRFFRKLIWSPWSP